MAQKKVYDNEFKIQAVKLGREIGFSKAAKESGINTDTLYCWNKRAKDARLDLGLGTQTPDSAMSLTGEVHKLRQQNKEQASENSDNLKEADLYIQQKQLHLYSSACSSSNALNRFSSIHDTVKGYNDSHHDGRQ